MKPASKVADLIAPVAFAVLVVLPSTASAQAVLSFDRDDPALVAFRQQPVAAAPQGAADLAIPVLGFVPTSTVPVPAGPPPVLVSDAARDPNWYSLVYDRGDVKITITGQLNYQEVPDAARLPDSPPEQFNMASDDDPGEPISAQATIYRFPRIPYVIDVICKSASTYQLCRSEQELRNLISGIGVLAAPQ
jgi:hypothetical protein